MKKLVYIVFLLTALRTVGQTPYVNQILAVGNNKILAFVKYYNNVDAFQHIYLSTNGGSSWKDTQDSTPYDGKTIVLSDGSLLHGTSGDYWGYYAGLYRSTDLGKSWKQIRNSIVTDFCAIGINEYSIVVGLKGTLGEIEGNDSLLYTNDGGLSWKKILELNPLYQSQINSVASFKNKIYINAYGKLLSSGDYGVVWDTVVNVIRPSSDSIEFACAASVNNENIFCQRLIYSTSSLSSIANNTSLLISSSGDSGSWIERAAPFYKCQTTTGIPMVARGGKLFTMSFLSCDTGKTWVDFSKNFINVYPSDSRYLTGIAIDSSGKCFYGDGEDIVSTSDCGETWSKTSLLSASVHDDAHVNTFSVYPNPITSSTTVHYSLDHYQFSKLELTDQLGRVLQTIRQANEEPGEKNISLSLVGLSVGVYYLHLQTDGLVATQKIIVAK